MKILTFHGLGRQEKNPETWQPLWSAALVESLACWSSVQPEVVHGDYDSLFGDTPMTASGTAEGFGRLLWDEIKYGIADNLWPFRRRSFSEGVSETVKWKIGMVTQFAEDAKLRERLRKHLAQQIEQHQPDVVFAHSLGTLLTYNLLLDPPNRELLQGRTSSRAGARSAVRRCGRFSADGSRRSS